MENGSSANLPVVGFSVGEPAGIGPQLLLTFLEREGWQEQLIPVLFGHRRVVERWRAYLNLRSLRYHVIRRPGEAKPAVLNLVECGEATDFSIGKATKESGALARQAIVEAVQQARAGELSLLVTLPVDKSTLYDPAAFPYLGHTEYLRASFPETPPLMLMVQEDLRVAVVTEHLPISAVPSTLQAGVVEQAIRILHKALQIDFAVPSPRIAVLGLNPHAGDNGLIGSEEQEWLIPLLRRLTEEGLFVGGPFSADGFFAAGEYRRADAVLAMYHDQGLIPFKILAGWEGFQYSAGLPFVRTSPDHGVAYDKVGSEEADISSLSAAVWEGLAIVRRRSSLKTGS